MSHYGGGVPWHRVVNASGRVVPGHEVEALRRHRAEGTPLRGPDRDKIDLKAAFWLPAPTQVRGGRRRRRGADRRLRRPCRRRRRSRSRRRSCPTLRSRSRPRPAPPAAPARGRAQPAVRSVPLRCAERRPVIVAERRGSEARRSRRRSAARRRGRRSASGRARSGSGTHRPSRSRAPVKPLVIRHDQRAHHRRYAPARRRCSDAQLALAEHRVEVDAGSGNPDAGAEPERQRDHTGVSGLVDDRDVRRITELVGAYPCKVCAIATARGPGGSMASSGSAAIVPIVSCRSRRPCTRRPAKRAVTTGRSRTRYERMSAQLRMPPSAWTVSAGQLADLARCRTRPARDRRASSAVVSRSGWCSSSPASRTTSGA